MVIGVDTHAAAHVLCFVTATTGAVQDKASFPTSPAGPDRPVPGLHTEKGSRLPSLPSKASDPTEPGSPTAFLQRLPNLRKWHQEIGGELVRPTRSTPLVSPGEFCSSTLIGCADHTRMDREWR